MTDDRRLTDELVEEKRKRWRRRRQFFQTSAIFFVMAVVFLLDQFFEVLIWVVLALACAAIWAFVVFRDPNPRSESSEDRP